MKNFCISLTVIIIIILTVVLGGAANRDEEYLRIHIRANSNAAEDQAVKLAVRDEVVGFLTPLVASCESRDELKKCLKSHINGIISVAEETLESHNFTYGARADIRREKFPTRVYDGLTLDEGIYDALIIELGEGKGDNWWCVVYPPLCFTGKEGGGIRYRSKIAELIERWKETSQKRA